MDKFYIQDVTLIIIDCKDLKRALIAINYSCRNFKFDSIKILTNIALEYDQNFIFIDPISKIEDYSEFCIKHLYKYIDTKFCLLIQWDGFIVGDKSTWSNEFLEYDYIGASWGWHINCKVGNGGFSLRTKLLMEEVSRLIPPPYHPEDEKICRNYRNELEDKGFTFAPDFIADKFSIENKIYNGQFGFHKPSSYPLFYDVIRDNAYLGEKLLQ